MNEQKNTTIIKTWHVTLFVVSLAASLIVVASSYRFSTTHSNDVSFPTITVTGDGEAQALPDIATITFTINQVSPTVKDAQKAVEDKMSKVSNSLKTLGIESKDVKTESYTVNPKYSYPQVVCYQSSCPTSSPKLDGYEVNESVTVKVRKVDQAGDVLALIGKNEVTNISGPNFSVENDDALVKTARALAVEKAKAKAKETVKALGATLGELKTYTEGNGGGYPYPMMYAKEASMDGASSAPQVTLAPGESKVKVNVTLVYTLK